MLDHWNVEATTKHLGEIGSRDSSLPWQNGKLWSHWGWLFQEAAVHGLETDVNERLQGDLIKFADDTKLGGVPNTIVNSRTIQGDRDIIEYWAEMNKMTFSRNKCKVK